MRKLLPILAFLAATPACAVQPDEILGDAALEARARALSAGLRCLVCQNQSIDDSDAPLAKDLRVLIRQHLVQGESDAQIVDFVAGRYGDFVLLKPRLNRATLLLWATPVAALLIAGLALWRRRRKAPALPELPLTEAEKAALRQALD